MASRIAGITVEIGGDTTKLSTALKGVNSEMGHSDISVTMNTYTHLGLDDAKEEMIRMEELNQARKELEKGQIDKAVTQKQFKVV